MHIAGINFELGKPPRPPKGFQIGDEAFLRLVSNGDYSSYNPASFGSIVVVGIGGSNLGTMAIWQALKGRDEKMLFAETLDARTLDRILKKIHNPALIVIVSKSGTTVETVANAAILLEKLKGAKVVAVTDENSKLWNWAKKRGYDAVPVPADIPGRYSVFTAVGLLPLAAAGVDVQKILKGVREMTQEPAAHSALAIYAALKKGKSIHDTFIFQPDLEGVGKWYRQLMGESIGKDGKGITPTVSIGSTDLHSLAQLYLDGPKDKFTTFISVKDHGKDFLIPDGSSDELIPAIAGKKFSDLLSAILQGVKNTYRKQKLPFVEIALENISEESIGALLQMKMIEMVYLAKLLGVNAFDQPAVELYKEETRKILNKL